MIDPGSDPTPEDETIILSKDVRACEPFTPSQITIAELGALAPTVSLYRFIHGEETQYMELCGTEMTRLTKAYTAKHAPVSEDITALLQYAKNVLDRASQSDCPDLIVSDVTHNLLRVFAEQFLAQEQQAQLKTILEVAASYSVSNREKVK